MSASAPPRGQEMARPRVGEFSPYYAGYLALVPEGDVRAFLAEQEERAAALLGRIPEHRWGHRYAEGRWSIREVVAHLNDTERIMAYRALRFARGDRTPVAGFDETAYVPQSGAEDRTMGDLVDEFRAVRRATLALVHSLPAAAWLRDGIANDARASVRALVWIIAGHAEHHLRLLRERYLVATG